MDINVLNDKVKMALRDCLKEEHKLIEVRVNERTITAKLACYLSPQFAGDDWDVDCEYNKKRYGMKGIEGIGECSKKKKTENIYPDIIVHKRLGEGRKNNLLVIEVKNGLREDPCDLRKLELLTYQDDNFAYQFGLYILGFTQGDKLKLKWFKNGVNFHEDLLNKSKD